MGIYCGKFVTAYINVKNFPFQLFQYIINFNLEFLILFYSFFTPCSK